MGIFEDYGALIPEDKREAFKAAVSALDGAVKIDSRDVAEKLLRENQFIKSVVDAGISHGVESFKTRFTTEDVPKLVDEEIKKRAPKPKDPELAAALERVAKLEAENTEKTDKAIKAEQRAVAIKLLSAIGLDAKMAEMFIGKTEEETTARFKTYFVSPDKNDIITWRDQYAEKLIKERFGNQGTPPMGKPPESTDLKALYEAALKAGKPDDALMYKERLEAAARVR